VSNEDADAPLYGLINNAAIFEYDNPRDFSLDAFDRHIASNLRAPLQLAHLFATQAVSNGQQGCIVNILDQKLFNLNPDYFSYTVSKYALLGATTMQAMSYGPMVRVNAVALGLLLPSGDQTDDEFEVASTHNILRRRTTIDDVVGALQFILTNPGCSGQVLKVDSGQHLLPLERDVMFKLRESS
jgi:NAD(P)-dependent dehydrogenase (short-subunit alcohol dehydrogenase family)